MKSLLIVLFVVIFSLTTFGQEVSTMNGRYEGYIDGTYVFTADDDYSTEFMNVTSDVTSKYDLKSQKFIGRQFSIYFTVDSELDKDDEEIQISTITRLLMPE